MPYYDFSEFKKACERTPGKVFPIDNVPRDARDIFNLSGKTQLLEFIANDGLQDLRFVNSKPWENNRDKNNPVMVDGYEFRTLGKLGYIAFMQSLGNWIIKSFHLSNNSNLTMLDELKRIGWVKENKR